MRWLVLVLLVAACDKVLGLKENQTRIDGGIDAPPSVACESGRTEIERNSFSDDVALFSKFDAYDMDGTNATVNGAYVATTKAPLGYASVQSSETFDMSMASAQLRLLQVPAPANTEAYFSLHFATDDKQYYFFSVSEYITMGRKQNGIDALDMKGVLYNAPVHAHIRYRHDRDTDVMVFETSADGADWIERHRIQVRFDLRMVRARFGAGAYPPDGNPKPQTGSFDDYLICR